MKPQNALYPPKSVKSIREIPKSALSVIKNVIFDFGNVLFDIDLPAIERRLRVLLGADFEAAVAVWQRDRVFELYETGGMSTAEFIDRLCHATPTPLQAEQVTDAWNGIFIGMPARRFEWLLELRRQYNVFLLSNINDLHERWIVDYMLREHGLPDYETRFFDGVYFSHLIRLRKPDPTIYEYVLADAEILPSETVFFDDLEQNVKGALACGIHAFVHPAGEEIITHARQVLQQFSSTL